MSKEKTLSVDTSLPAIGIRRAKPGIEDGPYFEGQPDEEPDVDARWLRGRAAAERHYREMTTTEERADRFLAIARRLEGPSPYVVQGNRSDAPPAPAWYSVDEPPEDGTWCWVTSGNLVWLGMRDSSLPGGWSSRKPSDAEKVPGVIICVTHWQPANVPEPPEGEEASE